MHIKIAFQNALVIIFLILVLGLIIILAVEYSISPNGSNVFNFSRDTFISSENFSQLADFATVVGLITSTVTIFLLYINFRHQQLELNKMNDLPLALYEKKKLSEMLERRKKMIDGVEGTRYKKFVSQLRGNLSTFLIVGGDKEITENIYTIFFEQSIQTIVFIPENGIKLFQELEDEINSKLLILKKNFSSPETIDLFFHELDINLIYVFRLVNTHFDLDRYHKQLKNSKYPVNTDEYRYLFYLGLLLNSFDKSILMETLKRQTKTKHDPLRKDSKENIR